MDVREGERSVHDTEGTFRPVRIFSVANRNMFNGISHPISTKLSSPVAEFTPEATKSEI